MKRVTDPGPLFEKGGPMRIVSDDRFPNRGQVIRFDHTAAAELGTFDGHQIVIVKRLKGWADRMGDLSRIMAHPDALMEAELKETIW